MSQDDDREGPVVRRSTGGTSVLLVVLLVGGFFALLLVLAVGFVGYVFMARSDAQQAEMRMVMDEERAISARELARAESRAVDATRRYSHEDFKTLVDGKTEQEVEDTLGKPTRIEQNETTSNWHYENRTFDRATGVTDPSVKLTFQFGRVTAITY